MSLRSFLSSFRSALPASVPRTPPASFTRGTELGIGTVRKAALSGDGRLMAVATSRGVAVYEIGPDRGAWSRRWFRATPAWSISVAVSQDGRRVAGCTHQGAVTVWDGDTGEELRALTAAGKACVALDREGRRVAVGDRAGVSLWDVGTAERQHGLAGTEDEITAVGFHPVRDQVAAVDFGGHVLLWDAASGRELRRWQGAKPLRDLAFDAEGTQLAVVGKDWTLWDIDTGLQVHTATAPGPMISVAFSRDGQRLVTGTARNRALIWSLETGARAHDLALHLSEVHSAAFAPGDAFLLLASQKVHRVDATSYRPTHTLPAFAGVSHIATSPDGALVAMADKQLITVWDAARGEAVAVLDGHAHVIHGLWFAPGGERVVSFSPAEIIGWDARSGERRWTMGGTSIGGASPTADRKTFAAAVEERGSYALVVCDAATGERTHTIGTVPRRGMGIHELVLGPDGTMLALRASSEVTVWSASRGERFRIDHVVNRDGAVRVAPDGKTLAVGMQSGEVVLWDLGGSRRRHALAGSEGGATSLIYSADGALLAGRFKGRPEDPVLVWDPATGRRLYGPLSGGDAICHALVFRPDNSALVAAFAAQSGEFGRVVAWHMATGELIASESGSAATALGFDPAGRLLVTGASDGTAALWRVGA